MSNKIMKRSVMLGALMAFVITGSAWAEAPKCVNQQGNYTFDGGTLNDQLVDLYAKQDSGSTAIEIKDNGIINVQDAVIIRV